MPAEREYPCLEPGQENTAHNRRHATRITESAARELIDSGLAETLYAHNKPVIKLKRATSPQAMDVRGPSCRMGPPVIEANADSKPWAQACLEYWSPNYFGLAPRVAV